MGLKKGVGVEACSKGSFRGGWSHWSIHFAEDGLIQVRDIMNPHCEWPGKASRKQTERHLKQAPIHELLGRMTPVRVENRNTVQTETVTGARETAGL